MTITLKLVEVNDGNYAVIRRDGLYHAWELSEITSEYPGNITFYATWPLSLNFSKYCFVKTEAEGLEAINKVAEAIMERKKKIKIVRTIKTVKVRV